MLMTDTRDFYKVYFKSKTDQDEDISICVAANNVEEAKSFAKSFLRSCIIEDFVIVSVCFLYRRKSKIFYDKKR